MFAVFRRRNRAVINPHQLHQALPWRFAIGIK
jgi:hypothetical protein